MSTAVCPARGATLGGPLPAAQPAPGGGGRASPPVPRPLRGQCGGCGCGGRQPAPSDVPTERVRPAHPGSLVFPWPPSTRGQCPGPGCPPPSAATGPRAPSVFPRRGGPRVQPQGPFLSRGSPGPVAAPRHPPPASSDPDEGGRPAVPAWGRAARARGDGRVGVPWSPRLPARRRQASPAPEALQPGPQRCGQPTRPPPHRHWGAEPCPTAPSTST